MNRTRESIGLALLAINLLCTIVVMTWGGFVLHLLWRWFVVPIWTIPSITILQAAGALLIVNAVHLQGGKCPWQSSDDFAGPARQTIVWSIERTVAWGFVLAVGFGIRWLGFHGIV